MDNWTIALTCCDECGIVPRSGASEGGSVAQTAAIEADDVLAGLRIIDCDAHFTEPPDLWSSRATGSLKDRVPRMRTVDGISSWYLGGRVLCSIGGNTIAKGAEKQLGTLSVK